MTNDQISMIQKITLLKESCYPYEAENGDCRFKPSCFYNHGIVTDFVYYYHGNEDQMKAMLLEYGPVVTSMDAKHLG